MYKMVFPQRFVCTDVWLLFVLPRWQLLMIVEYDGPMIFRSKSRRTFHNFMVFFVFRLFLTGTPNWHIFLRIFLMEKGRWDLKMCTHSFYCSLKLLTKYVTFSGSDGCLFKPKCRWLWRECGEYEIKIDGRF